VEDAGTSNFVRAYASSLVVVGSVFHDAGVEDRQTLLSRINNAPLAPGQEPRRVQESWPVEARVENRVVVRRRGRLYSIKEDSAEDIVLFDEEAKSGHNVFRTKKAALEALNKEKK
jgi:ribosomal protein L36